MQLADELQTIKSLHEMEFTGSSRIQSAVFSPDGSIVHVQMVGEVIDLWPILMAYWPAIGGTLLLFAVLIFGWRLMRVRSSSERVGAWVCRRCRYEVTPLVDEDGWPQEGAICTECGRSLGQKRARRGRSTTRRLFVSMTVLGMVASAFGLGMVAKFAGWPGDSSRMLLPSSALAIWAQEIGNAWLTKQIKHVDRLVQIDSATGDQMRDRSFQRVTYEPMLLSEDGKTFYRMNISRVPAQRKFVIEAMDLSSGRVRVIAEVPIDAGPGATSNAQSLVGFLDSGQKLLVVGRRADTHLAFSVDIDTGKVTELISEVAIAKREAWTGVVDNVYDAGMLVTCSGFSEMYAKDQSVIRVYELGETCTLLVTHTFAAGPRILNESVSTGAAPVLFPNRKQIAIKSGDVTRGIMGVDILTGDTAYLNGGGAAETYMPFWDNIALSHDGKWMVLAEIGKQDAVLKLRDTHAKQWRAELHLSRSLVRPVSAFSRDARKLVSHGFYTTLDSNQQKKTHYRLVLFDLKPKR